MRDVTLLLSYSMRTLGQFLIPILVLLLLTAPVFAQKEATNAGKRQSILERVAAKRQVASEAAKVKREAFQKRVAQIQDTKKKAIVERIDTRLQEINTKRTDQMAQFLERLEKILKKIETRTEKAKQKGLNVAKVETGIGEARTAINTAKTAVETQAGKSYTIEITSETGLKNAVGKTVSSLQKDLRNTHKLVTQAKQAVQKLFSLLREIKGVDNAE